MATTHDHRDTPAADTHAPLPATMQAASFARYGPPEVVQLTTVPVPTITAEDVLVRVEAAAVQPYDWHHYRGEPLLFVRPAKGLLRPRRPMTIGADVAGVVERVGADVTTLAPGDRVYGEIGAGACAEFAAAPANRLAVIPDELTFAEAAAVPMGALTAMQGLVNAGIPRGARVLVNGASGGVGHMAIQVAKALGADHVTGVCSTRNLDLVRDLGADEVIDYTTRDLLDQRDHDVVVDTVGNHSTRALSRLLRPTGALVLVGGGRGRWVEPGGQVLRGLAQSPFLRPRVVAVMDVDSTATALGRVSEMVRAGALRPAIERTYPLARLHDALHHLEGGHVRGKVVITT